MRLWVPHLQRQWLARTIPDDDDDDQRPTITTNDEEPPNEPPEPRTERDGVRHALAAYWGPTFRPRPTNREESRRLAEQNVRPLPDPEWPAPTASTFRRLLKRTRDSAPGPDGIPYSGWRAAGHLAHNVLARVSIYAATTGRMIGGLITSISFFSAEGSSEDDPTTSGARERLASSTPRAQGHGGKGDRGSHKWAPQTSLALMDGSSATRFHQRPGHDFEHPAFGDSCWHCHHRALRPPVDDDRRWRRRRADYTAQRQPCRGTSGPACAALAGHNTQTTHVAAHRRRRRTQDDTTPTARGFRRLRGTTHHPDEFHD